MRILLVDDEAGIREGLAALLRRRGHDVRTAADCAAAAVGLADDLDVLVTDWRLPDGVAATFLAAARCPAIVVSGHPEDVGPASGAAVVLAKPLRPDALLAAIDGVVRAPEARGGAGLDADAVAAGMRAFADGMPAGCAIRIFDDGVFATAVVDLPDGREPPEAPSIGDYRRTAQGGRWQVAWRVPRDAAAGASPGEAADPADPVHGNAHGMPMSEPIGLRLPAELADLWSEP